MLSTPSQPPYSPLTTDHQRYDHNQGPSPSRLTSSQHTHLFLVALGPTSWFSHIVVPPGRTGTSYQKSRESFAASHSLHVPSLVVASISNLYRVAKQSSVNESIKKCTILGIFPRSHDRPSQPRILTSSKPSTSAHTLDRPTLSRQSSRLGHEPNALRSRRQHF